MVGAFLLQFAKQKRKIYEKKDIVETLKDTVLKSDSFISNSLALLVYDTKPVYFTANYINIVAQTNKKRKIHDYS